jgi:hypothetical protein
VKDADAGDEANLVEFLNAKRKLRLGIGNCRPGFFAAPKARHPHTIADF